jgi:hypothetical protein
MNERPVITRQQRRAIMRAVYGRYDDWLLEQHGRPIARLTDARHDLIRQFWFSYRIIPLDESVAALLLTPAFWDTYYEYTFRNVRFGLPAREAFPAAAGPHDGRIALRGLVIDLPPVNRWERLLLWCVP